MKATIAMTKEAQKRGEYKETSLDAYKKNADFLIISCGYRSAISFNKPVERKPFYQPCKLWWSCLLCN